MNRSSMHLNNGELSSLILILGCLILLFIAPLLGGDSQQLLFSASYTVIFFAALFSIRAKRELIGVAVVLIGLQITGQWFELKYVDLIASLSRIAFFTYVVFKLIIIIASKKEINVLILLDAISVYLLIAITFFIFNMIVLRLYPEAILTSGGDTLNPGQVIYYTLITLTTLGYGDMVPNIPLSRSLAAFCAISGQIYLTMVIALIVGKYLSKVTNQ